jgi:hypothetical protein
MRYSMGVRRPRIRSLLLLLLLLQPATATNVLADRSPGARVPSLVHVRYSPEACGGERADGIELEVWSRGLSAWTPHPDHPRIEPGACELEDEALLWDEMRWRCAGSDERWTVGVDMFDDGNAQRCGLGPGARVFGDMRIELRSPAPGVPVRATEPAATVAGNVLVGGRRGVHYDVVVAIDVSADGGQERIERQVAAARQFVRHAHDRLGDVRIGLLVHPAPRVGAEAGARREIALTEDVRALEAALSRVAERGPASESVSSDFSAALASGMAETQYLQLSADEGARLYSRRVLLMSGAPEVASGAAQRRIDDLARSARERGIAIHFFALGDAGSQRPPQPEWVDRVLRHARGSFTHVEPQRSEASYLREAGLPYLSDLRVRNETTGQESREVRFDETGRFRARVPAAFGHNEISVAASSSLGETVHARYTFEFDGSLVRERLRAAERARIEQLRRERRVQIGPAPLQEP